MKEKLKQVEDKLDAADSKANTATRTRRGLKIGAKRNLSEIWPELRSEWAPLAIDLATDRAMNLSAACKKLPDYATLGYAKKREEELTEGFHATGTREAR